MQYILHVMSYEGIVPGASHYRGRVEGEHPKPCCPGGTMFSNLGHTCMQGHKLPEQVRWNVEADWSEARMERYLAACRKALFEDSRAPDGPEQFDTKEAVIDRAMVQFLDGMDKVNDPAAEGDELWYGWVNPEGGQFDEYTDPEDGWGMRIAVCHRG